MVGPIANTMIIPNNRQEGVLRVFNSEVQCIPHTRRLLQWLCRQD